MSKEKVFLIGGGGHCISCIDVIEQEGKYEIAGIFDLAENIGRDVLGYKILDSDNNLQKYKGITTNVLLTLGQIKSAKLRVAKYNELKQEGFQFVTVVSPRAHVSKHAKLGEGVIVMHDSLVNAGAIIGNNCILNTKCLIEHNALVGAHSHISTAAVVNGDVSVGEQSFVGSNAVIKQGISIKEGAVIQAGTFYRGELS